MKTNLRRRPESVMKRVSLALGAMFFAVFVLAPKRSRRHSG